MQHESWFEFNVRRFEALERQRNALLGDKIANQINLLALSYEVTNKNYEELMNFLDKMEEKENQMKFISGRDPRFKEFVRLLSNYLAGLFALRDHVRKMRRSCENKEFEEEYKQKMKIFDQVPSLKFVDHLRDIMLHVHFRPPFVELDAREDKSHSLGWQIKQKFYILTDGELTKDSLTEEMPKDKQRRVEVRWLLTHHKKVFDECNHWAIQKYKEVNSHLLEPWLKLNREAQEVGDKIEKEIESRGSGI